LKVLLGVVPLPVYRLVSSRTVPCGFLIIYS
jgi:hypothetical protein